LELQVSANPDGREVDQEPPTDEEWAAADRFDASWPDVDANGDIEEEDEEEESEKEEGEEEEDDEPVAPPPSKWTSPTPPPPKSEKAPRPLAVASPAKVTSPVQKIRFGEKPAAKSAVRRAAKAVVHDLPAMPK
jgi:hypothetical protein